MTTTKFIWIDGAAYSPNHPLAKIKAKNDLRLAAQAGGSVANQPKNMQQGQTRLNKTEQKYFDTLCLRFPMGHVSHHTIKLQLAEKCWYTPDLFYTLPTGALVFVEIKGGHEWDDAIVKLKTAARQFPQFTFIKAKYKNGMWTETVMPK